MDKMFSVMDSKNKKIVGYFTNYEKATKISNNLEKAFGSVFPVEIFNPNPDVCLVFVYDSNKKFEKIDYTEDFVDDGDAYGTSISGGYKDEVSAEPFGNRYYIEGPNVEDILGPKDIIADESYNQYKIKKIEEAIEEAIYLNSEEYANKCDLARKKEEDEIWAQIQEHYLELHLVETK
jgi:hypothetical protein